MSSKLSFIKTIIASALVLVALAMPGRAEFDFNKQFDGVSEQVGEQLNGLGNFFDQFGKDMSEGVKAVTPEPDIAKITTGSTRDVVAIDANYEPGAVVIRTSTRKLYYVLSPGRALQYGVGVGREGFQWGGESHISRKKEWPDWRPPKEMIERERVKNRLRQISMRVGRGCARVFGSILWVFEAGFEYISRFYTKHRHLRAQNGAHVRPNETK